MEIKRHQRGLNVSGKQIPSVGGGWNTSRYNCNQFIKKSRCVGIVFESQKAGHNKAYIIQHNIIIFQFRMENNSFRNTAVL